MPRPGHFTTGKETLDQLHRRQGGNQSRSGRMRKISLPLGFNHRTAQSVASRCTDWAIPALISLIKYKSFVVIYLTHFSYPQRQQDKHAMAMNWLNRNAYSAWRCAINSCSAGSRLGLVGFASLCTDWCRQNISNYAPVYYSLIAKSYDAV